MARRIVEDVELQGMMFPQIFAESLDAKSPQNPINTTTERRMSKMDRYILGVLKKFSFSTVSLNVLQCLKIKSLQYKDLNFKLEGLLNK